jgi:hypothetical protein
MFPAPSTVNPVGSAKVATEAGPPSPTEPPTLYLPDRIIAAIRNQKILRSIECQASRCAKHRIPRRAVISAVAGHTRSRHQADRLRLGVDSPYCVVFGVGDIDVSLCIDRHRAWFPQRCHDCRLTIA